VETRWRKPISISDGDEDQNSNPDEIQVQIFAVTQRQGWP